MTANLVNANGEDDIQAYLESKSFNFQILNSSTSVYFWPIGSISLEPEGTISLTFNGEYEEYETLDYFFDISIFYSNGTVAGIANNISQSTIGMNLIWGFGGFSPNFVCSSNWTDNDQIALSVANSPNTALWPGLNGTLEIQDSDEFHTYDFIQNPLNGTQETYLKYDKGHSILVEFKSTFSNYYLHAVESDYWEKESSKSSITIPGFSLIGIITLSISTSLLIQKRNFYNSFQTK